MQSFNHFLPYLQNLTPVPIGLDAHCSVTKQIISDGLSRPRISTVLRGWAIGQHDVLRITLYHTGVRYSVATLVFEPTIARIRSLNQRLIAHLHELFPPDIPIETYIIGEEFRNARMFHRFGAITLYDKLDQAAVPQTDSN